MSKIDLDRIEAVAKAAQERSPGPWRRQCTQWRCDGDGCEHCEHCDYIYDSAPRPEDWEDETWLGNRVLETDSGYYEPKGATAVHIETCSPDVVLALVQRVRELERRVHSDDCMGCTRCT